MVWNMNGINPSLWRDLAGYGTIFLSERAGIDHSDFGVAVLMGMLTGKNSNAFSSRYSHHVYRDFSNYLPLAIFYFHHPDEYMRPLGRATFLVPI